jgi:hypothetical protein
LQGWTGGAGPWTARAQPSTPGLRRHSWPAAPAPDGHWLPSYAQLIAEIHDGATAEDRHPSPRAGRRVINVNWGKPRGYRNGEYHGNTGPPGNEIAGKWVRHRLTSVAAYAWAWRWSYLSDELDIFTRPCYPARSSRGLVVCDNEGAASHRTPQKKSGSAVRPSNNIRMQPGSCASRSPRLHAQALRGTLPTVNDIILQELRQPLLQP